MNEPQLFSISYLVFLDKNPPGKQADEGGNAWIRSTEENGIQQFILDWDNLFHHAEFYGSKHWHSGKTAGMWQLSLSMFLSIHRTSKRHNNWSTEKRATLQTATNSACQQKSHVVSKLVISHAEDTIITNNKWQTQVWTAEHYLNKQQEIIHGGEQLTRDELKARFSTPTA